MKSLKCLAVVSKQFDHVMYFTQDTNILEKTEWLKVNAYAFPVTLLKDKNTGMIEIKDSSLMKVCIDGSIQYVPRLHSEESIFYNLPEEFKTDIQHWNLFIDSQLFDGCSLESKLLELLPHGSGIDYNWSFNFLKNGKIQAFNAYHAMDENGYYCHIYDFKVTLHYNRFSFFKLDSVHLTNGCKELTCCGYDLKSYLWDTLDYSLSYQ